MKNTSLFSSSPLFFLFSGSVDCLVKFCLKFLFEWAQQLSMIHSGCTQVSLQQLFAGNEYLACAGVFSVASPGSF